MKKVLLLFIIVLFSNVQAQERPKLVVGIVVDQMKMEYLYRFSNDFSENGFKRLMNKGYAQVGFVFELVKYLRIKNKNG